MTTATATALQMVRAEIDLREFNRWMGSRQLQDPDHAMHCLLKECFGELAPKPFRLAATHGASRASLYGYGHADAEELRDAASTFACPLQSRVLTANRIDSKPMPTEWRAGRRLGFEARVRPVVRLNKDLALPSRGGTRRAGAECDAFQREALRHPKGEMKRTREDVYVDWLACRFERQGGASLDKDKTKLVSFRRTRAIRKRHRRYSEGPDAVMRGVLTIDDVTEFGALLARGIGRHRAYGYGMVLLRPARA